MIRAIVNKPRCGAILAFSEVSIGRHEANGWINLTRIFLCMTPCVLTMWPWIAGFARRFAPHAPAGQNAPPPPQSTTACRISRLDSFHSPRQDIEPSSWRNYSTKRQYAAMSFKTNQLGKDRLASNDHIPTTQFSSGTVDQLPWRHSQVKSGARRPSKALRRRFS